MLIAGIVDAQRLAAILPRERPAQRGSYRFHGSIVLQRVDALSVGKQRQDIAHAHFQSGGILFLLRRRFSGRNLIDNNTVGLFFASRDGGDAHQPYQLTLAGRDGGKRWAGDDVTLIGIGIGRPFLVPGKNAQL